MSDLRCYCCGREVEKHFFLYQMTRGSDRVFVMAPGCEKKIERYKQDVLIEVHTDVVRTKRD